MLIAVDYAALLFYLGHLHIYRVLLKINMITITATEAARIQGIFRQMPGRAAQCCLSLHLSQTLIQYSAISGTFLTQVVNVDIARFRQGLLLLP